TAEDDADFGQSPGTATMNDHRVNDRRPDESRRGFLKGMGLGAAGGAAGRRPAAGGPAGGGQRGPSPPPPPGAAPRATRPAARRNPIGVSTYSFWQFRGRRLDIVDCIDRAAAMGFDGVEVLHVQMADESNAALQKIKRRAHSLGLALMGFSTHQGFVNPEPQ